MLTLSLVPRAGIAAVIHTDEVTRFPFFCFHLGPIRVPNYSWCLWGIWVLRSTMTRWRKRSQHSEPWPIAEWSQVRIHVLWIEQSRGLSLLLPRSENNSEDPPGPHYLILFIRPGLCRSERREMHPEILWQSPFFAFHEVACLTLCAEWLIFEILLLDERDNLEFIAIIGSSLKCCIWRAHWHY